MCKLSVITIKCNIIGCFGGRGFCFSQEVSSQVSMPEKLAQRGPMFYAHWLGETFGAKNKRK